MAVSASRVPRALSRRPVPERVPRTLAGIVVGDRVDGRDGPLGRVAGTREATATRPAYVLVQLSSRLGTVHTTHAVPVAWIRAALPGAHCVTLDVGRAEVAARPAAQPAG
jgi:hypothetical protein